jgi:hypothetical protein
VVVVDVMPHPVEPDLSTPWAREALAIVLAERRLRLDVLRAGGAPVVRWEPDLVMAHLRGWARRRHRRSS